MSEKDKKGLLEIIPEEGGNFLRLQFDDLQEPLLLFVADADYEGLEKMAADPDQSWEDFREELFSLLEHSGHREEHELSKDKVLQIQKMITEEV